jgi:hypothetical protein
MGALSAKRSRELSKSNGTSPEQSAAWLGKRLGKTLQSYPMANLDSDGMKHFIAEWSLILAEVGEDRFDKALTEHIRESKFFPTIAEVRERAGMRKVDMDSAEAMDHWVRLKRFINANYYEDLGGLQNADKIPARARYAMNAVGGARAIYFMEMDAEPFKKKDFLEAYRLAPAHERMRQAELGTTLAGCLESGEETEQ